MLWRHQRRRAEGDALMISAWRCMYVLWTTVHGYEMPSQHSSSHPWHRTVRTQPLPLRTQRVETRRASGKRHTRGSEHLVRISLSAVTAPSHAFSTTQYLNPGRSRQSPPEAKLGFHRRSCATETACLPARKTHEFISAVSASLVPEGVYAA